MKFIEDFRERWRARSGKRDLLSAILDGDADEVDRIVSSLPSVIHLPLDKAERPPLFYALTSPENDSVRIVSRLIEGGADVNGADAEGITPLEYALLPLDPDILKEVKIELGHSLGPWMVKQKLLFGHQEELSANQSTGIGTILPKEFLANFLVQVPAKVEALLESGAEVNQSGFPWFGKPLEMVPSLEDCPSDEWRSIVETVRKMLIDKGAIDSS